ncbi:unnamed protein product, partial [Chrysoparadoxa australica]
VERFEAERLAEIERMKAERTAEVDRLDQERLEAERLTKVMLLEKSLVESNSEREESNIQLQVALADVKALREQLRLGVQEREEIKLDLACYLRELEEEESKLSHKIRVTDRLMTWSLSKQKEALARTTFAAWQCHVSHRKAKALASEANAGWGLCRANRDISIQRNWF